MELFKPYNKRLAMIQNEKPVMLGIIEIIREILHAFPQDRITAEKRYELLNEIRKLETRFEQ